MNGPLSILHCLRAPIGGLFRHVCDLAAEQAEMGHRVGVVCDSGAASTLSESALGNLGDNICALGVHRVAMSRGMGLGDWKASWAVRRIARDTDARILHGHGAKGGAYARLAAHALKRKGSDVRAFYTPHGGSLHYGPSSLRGLIITKLEQRLARKTDGLIFESDYSSQLYRTNIGEFPCDARVIHNGLKPHEFYEAVVDENACDFVFIGELRHLKGLDLLLGALAGLRKETPVTTYIAGDGPDANKLVALARKLGLASAISFVGTVPAGAAFSRGRCLVMPSRAESFPYILLEAAAARLPFIATGIGGIPEIVEGTEVALLPPDDMDALTAEMRRFLDKPDTFMKRAEALQVSVRKRFSAREMAREITEFYQGASPDM